MEMEVKARSLSIGFLVGFYTIAIARMSVLSCTSFSFVIVNKLAVLDIQLAGFCDVNQIYKQSYIFLDHETFSTAFRKKRVLGNGTSELSIFYLRVS